MTIVPMVRNRYAAPVSSWRKPAWSNRAKNRAVIVASQAALKVVSRLSERTMRLAAGGRSLTVEGNTLDPMLQLLRIGQRVMGLQGLVDGDVDQARTYVRSTAGVIAGADIGVEVENLTIPGPAGPIPARHYRPPDSQGAPLLVYIHGGGFVIADLDVYDGVCRLIARDAGVHVLSVDYRLAPEHKAPAALDDSYAAYRWAVVHAADLGADPNRVAVGGDSAGGNLAAGVCLRARDDNALAPFLQLLIYPMVDATGSTRSEKLFRSGFFLTERDIAWFVDNYLGGSGLEPTDPRVSPRFAEDLSGLPLALVVTAGFDPLRDQGDDYAKALRDAGVPVDHRSFGSMTHMFVNYALLGGGCARAMAEVNSALRAHLVHA